MFSKTLVASTVLALVAGTVADKPASQCNTGPVQCCNSVQTTNTAAVQSVVASLGIPAGEVVFPAALTCSPITVVGPGSGASCSGQAVCCTDNNWNGVINFGCTAVNINL